jgi:hypothetical protein
MLQFIYAYFGGSSVGEADKIGKKKSYIPQFPDDCKLSYVTRLRGLCSSVL